MFAQLAVQPHLWILTPDPVADPAWAAEHLPLLSPSERARYDRYLRDSDRDLFLAAHVFTRHTLSRYGAISPAAWAFDTNEFGRPEITNPDAPPGLRFNLSHTEGMVAMLVHDTVDGGVDVERLGAVGDPLSMSKTVFAAAERRDYLAVDERDQEQRFYTLWTLKEAFIKATGKGLAIPLKSFAFTGIDGPEIAVVCATGIEPEPAAWHFTVRQPAPEFLIATAYRAGATPHDHSVAVFEAR